MSDGRSIHERLDAIEHHLFGERLHDKVVADKGENDPNNPLAAVAVVPSAYVPEEKNNESGNHSE